MSSNGLHLLRRIERGCMGFSRWKSFGMRKDGALLPRSIEARPQSRFLFSVADNSPLVTKMKRKGYGKKSGTTRLYSQPTTEVGRHTAKLCSASVLECNGEKGGLKWWMAFLEKYGTPWLVMYAAKGADKALFEAGKKPSGTPYY